MFKLEVWQNVVRVHWDQQTLPTGSVFSLAHYLETPDMILGHFGDISKFLRFQKKMGCFLCSLSWQNLSRIKTHLGDNVTFIGTRKHLEAFYAKRENFRKMCISAERLKENGFNRSDPIPYKLPPLAAYQDEATRFLIHTPSVALFADPGMGKTFMVLCSTQEQFRRGIVRPGKVLIAAKLLTLETGWLRDCEKFTHMKPVVLWEPPGTKRKEKILAKLKEPADIFIINHDGLRVFEDELAAVGFDKVVIDESTVLKSFLGTHKGFKGGKIGQSLIHIADKSQYCVIMTGTPAPNSSLDLWGQFIFLDPDGILLEKTSKDFKNAHMREITFGNQPNAPSTWKDTREGKENVGRSIKPITLRYRIRDHLKDLPERTVIDRLFTMTSEQRKHYDDLEIRLMTVINDSTISVDQKITEMGKLRQVTGGFLIDHQEEIHKLKENPKLQMLSDLIDDEVPPDCKVVVFAQFRNEIETIAEHFSSLQPLTVYGGNSSGENLRNVKEFIDNPARKLIVLHPKSAAHGITFTCAHHLVFYSVSYSAEENFQCIARIERAGQKHPMFVYYLLARNSIDMAIFCAIDLKNANQAQIIDSDKLFQSLIPKESELSLTKVKKHGKVRKTKPVPL
jgi:SNF2 family DNA or RNA helicase